MQKQINILMFHVFLKFLIFNVLPVPVNVEAEIVRLETAPGSGPADTVVHIVVAITTVMITTVMIHTAVLQVTQQKRAKTN